MNIIVLGCGRMGSELAKTLSFRRHAVTVVDVDPAAFERLGGKFPGRTVTGNAIDRKTLVAAGVERAPGGRPPLPVLLCHPHLDTVISLGSGEVDIVETEVPPLLIGRSVPELRVPGEIRVVAITREGRTFLPGDGTVFCKGDRLHIALLGASSERLRTLLGLG